MLLRVVFDTNILVSAVGWRGTPAACLDAARSGRVIAISCPTLIDELAEILRRKLHLTEEDIAATVADLLGCMQLVETPGTLRVIDADPDDDRVLECAVVGAADLIVSGDRRHLLPIGTYEGIAIVSAADFLALLASREPKL